MWAARLELVKNKIKLRTFWGWETRQQKVKITMIYAPF